MPKFAGTMQRYLVAILWFFLFSSHTSMANDTSTYQFQEIHNLKSDTWYFDPGSQLFIPHTTEQSPLATFFIDVKRYHGFQLYLELPAGVSVFFNDHIYGKWEQPSTHMIAMDSLRQFTGSDSINATLYCERDEWFNQAQAKVVTLEPDIYENAFNDVQAKVVNPFYEFVKLAIIIIALIHAIYFAMLPRHFRDYFSVGRSVLGRIREDSLYKEGPGARDNFLFILGYALVFAYLIMLMLYFSGIYFSYFEQTFSLGVSLTVWIGLTLLTIILIFLKFNLIKLIANILNKRALIYIHFYDSLRLSYTFFATLFVFISAWIVVSVAAGVNAQLLIYISAIFLSLKVILLYPKFKRTALNNNLQLFSYLCVTEILPMVLGLKFILTIVLPGKFS